MSHFNHAFQKMFLGIKDSALEAFAGQAGTALTQAGIEHGYITSSVTTNGGSTKLTTADLQSYGLGAGTFGLFDSKTYEIQQQTDDNSPCCPLILASASLMTVDKIGPFHGGYQESTKSKMINPKYVNKFYYVPACSPRNAVKSIGTTPYTSQTIGAVATLAAFTPAGADYIDEELCTTTGGTGVGCTIRIKSVDGAGEPQTIALVDAGTGYTVGDTLTIIGADVHAIAATVDVATITPAVTGSCDKEFLCGETYYLRIDLKGSPVLRALHHNAYMTVPAYTGCCSGAEPVGVDPTLVYIQWAEQIIRYPYLSAFVMPVVFDFEGTAWYAPGTTVTLDGTATPVTSAQWWDSYAPAAPWVNENTGGMRLYGAYVDTKFGNCSFQVTDHYELEPVRIYASMVDLNGDPCTFEQICVYTECDGFQGQGFGETVLRDLILSESYLQNVVPSSDPRLREVLHGFDIINSVSRTGAYGRYYIQHVVPRFNNPSGMFDSDQYLLCIPVLDRSTTFETFVNGWLSCNTETTACVQLEAHECGDCIIAPDAALINPN